MTRISRTLYGDPAKLTDEQLERMDLTPPDDQDGKLTALVVVFTFAALLSLGLAVAINSAIHWHVESRLEAAE